MVEFNRNDLEFILRQIDIAEQHASGTPLTELIPNPLLPWGLRTVDGTYNNIIEGRETWGAADQDFLRLLEPQFRAAGILPPGFDPDGPGPQAPGQQTTYEQTSGVVYDGEPRLISNLVVDQTVANPAAVMAALKFAGITGSAAHTLMTSLYSAISSAQTNLQTQLAEVATAQTAFNTAQQALDDAIANNPVAPTLAAYDSALSSITTALAEAAQLDATTTALVAAFAANGTTPDAADIAALDAARADAAELLAQIDAAIAALQSDAGVAPSDITAAQTVRSAVANVQTGLAVIDIDTPDTTNGGGAANVGGIDTLLALGADSSVAGIIANLTSLQSTLESSRATVEASGPDLAALEQARDDAQDALDAEIADVAPAEAALTAAQDGFRSTLEANGVEFDGSSIVIPNVAPDEGISAPFNSWMTLFGQFFDHGLDLVNKGGNGIVIIPLEPGDPNYVEGSFTNFMVLTRATNQDGTREHNNQTTPFVDQNQTYTSHASHQVFLREYELREGVPVATGHLLEGQNGGLATWADIKAQAADLLGIQLVDTDILNIPLLRTDPYGKFIPGANGYPQIVVGIGADGIPNTDDDVTIEGDPAASGGEGVLLPANTVRIGHAFLDDIAHAAVPVGDHDGNPGTPQQALTADADGATGGSLDPVALGEYDDELLDRHFITGDGRGNENIGLTAVHHVFHSEHNRLAEHTKDVVIETGDLGFVNQWLLTAIDQSTLDAITNETDAAAKALAIDALDWNGERVFQTARFGTEMQYQHLVFEEFARKVNPMVDLFVFNPTMDINPAIFAEFAHAIYRFGHSMLTETVARTGVGGQSGNPDADQLADMSLIDAFLNPVAFDADGAVSADVAAGAIARGMTRQQGSEIDEFVVDALRNFLVGLPLDLAALNIARARDTGVPSLNQARAEFYEMTRSDWLKPYTSWTDFAQNLKNPASAINFIAAYGTHEAIANATSALAKREAATLLVLGDGNNADGVTIHGVTYSNTDRLDFLNARGAYAGGSLGGLDNVDLWIGGLAEAILPFGGMLGSTFTFVFEAQMESLQNGDRFYYLSRTQGLHFLTELENNAFSKIIMANTDMSEEGNHAHLPGEVFARVDHILEVDQSLQLEDDPVGDDPVLEAFQPKVVRDSNVTIDTKTYDNMLQITGGEHVVLGGTNQDDVLIGDLGDDTIWGDGGDDYIVGGHGINRLHGGTGDDIIWGGGDPEFLHGDEGNDVIHAGNGLGDLVFAGTGHDFVFAGIDGTEVFGGEGNDFILGTPDVDFLLGGEGDDWIEGGEGFDTLAGDNSELFFNSTVIGHDVLFAGTNENDFDAESGDDIMVQGESVMRNEGMLGFDWVTFQEHTNFGVTVNMNVKIFTTVFDDILRNRFDRVEALSGTTFNDTIIGDSRVAPDGPFVDAIPVNEQSLEGDELNREGVERIKGLHEILGFDSIEDLRAAFPNASDIVFNSGNILLGSGGSDRIQGEGGDDIIDGDAALEVRIGILDANGNEIGTAYKMQGPVHFYDLAEAASLGEGYAAASAALLLREGAPLDEFLFDRSVNPGNLRIVREIADRGQDGDIDIAVFRGNQADYDVTINADGTVTVVHNAVVGGGNTIADGTDTLRNIEILQFADGLQFLDPALEAQNSPATGNLLIVESDPGSPAAVGETFTVTLGDPLNGGVADANGLPALSQFSISWEVELDPAGAPGVFTPIEDPVTEAPITGTSFTPTPAFEIDGLRIRAVATFADGNGIPEFVSSLPTEPLAAAATGLPTPGDDILFGTVLADTIDALAGDDQVFGFAGNDTLIGGPGSDILNGGAGFDTAVFEGPFTDFEFVFTPNGIEVVNTVTGEEDEVISIEQFVFVDNGNPGAPVPLAVIEALSTADTIVVGDTVVSNADDVIVDLPGNALVIDTLGGNDIVFGLDLADDITGGAGNDTLHGGQGADRLDGGADIDTASYAGSAELVRVNLSTGINTGGDAQGDTLISIENLVGSDFGDFLTGSNGANRIEGGAGGDSIYAMAGDDVVIGGLGNDFMLGYAGADTIDGGEGTDTAAYHFSNEAVTVNLTTGVHSGGHAAGDTLISIENLWGSFVHDDTLTGDGNANVLNGLSGNDTLNGMGGNDTLLWWARDGGMKTIDGGDDVDTFEATGNADDETFHIYTRAAAIAAGLSVGGANTEIVVTRNITGAAPTDADRIALLDNIEEIVINAGNGTNVVEAFGNFSETSLLPNTITVQGGTGNDTVDISGLLSAHRIVFKSNGGHDTILGALRPQDVIRLPDGAGTVSETLNGDGTKTISYGTNSVTFQASSNPIFVGGPFGEPQSDPGSAMSFTASDVAELLKLVKGVPSINSDEPGSTGVRDLEGTGNNIANPDWGSADQSFIRLTQARYGAYDEAENNRSINPIFDGLDPRNISNALGAQEDGLAKNAAGGNIFLMAFGQYFDHGLDFLPKGGYGNLAIGTQDHGPDDPADLTRGSLNNLAAVQNGATPEHTNKTSPFVDQNQAYGSTELVGQFLREGNGSGGLGARLLSGGPDPSNPEFNLLPSLRETILHHWENNTVFTSEKLISQGYANGQVSFRDYFTADDIPLVDENGVINELMAHALNSDFMGSGHTLIGDANNFINVLDHYLAGDLRANENYTLTSMHTIWARNHNYHVEKLSQAGFAGTAEELYQAAKIVNEAEYQKVVFEEFADYLIGGIRGSGHHGHDDYNPNADARISHEFAAAVYRVGHSLIGQNITILDENGTPHSVPLYDAFLNPTNDVGAFQLDTGPGGILTGQAAIDALAQYGYSPQEGFEQLGVNAIIGGIVQQQAEEVDFNIVDAVRNDLVRIRADLFAFNVARGWDVGLGTLNQVRADLLASTDPYIREAVELSDADLSPYVSWEDFQQRNGLSDAVIAQFQAAYPDLHLDTAEKRAAFLAANPDYALGPDNIVKGIDRVDLWVGGLAETHINGGMVGATFWVVLHEQFDRLQEGDRFYYTDRVDGFDFYALSQEQTFADIVRRNTGLEGLDDDIFAATALDAGDDDTAASGNETPAVGDTTSDDSGAVAGSDTNDDGGADVADSGGLTLHGDDEANTMFGSAGDDMIDGAGGDDIVAAGGGDDFVLGGAGKDRISGGAGDDTLGGGANRDVVDGGEGNDTIIATANDGDDAYHGGGGIDTLDMESVEADITVDLGANGFADSDETGFDTLDGIENFIGGSGNDTIIAGEGINVMMGGAGSDTFVFETVADADGDTIVGFSAGDKVDLGAMASSLGFDSGFTLVTAGTFNAAGQIQLRVDGADTFLEGNVNNDNSADFSIKIAGRTDLAEQDLA